MSNGKMYIISTPIGNLEDITLRALKVLRSVDLIACEDTRVTVKLLNHYNIKKPLISYHQHSRLQKLSLIVDKLRKGDNIALVTDAGTPGISDPGNTLVAELLNYQITIVPVPGPSALTTLASVAGLNMQKFVFLGFPPHKKGRKEFFQEVSSAKYPVVYFESPHRVLKNLKLLAILAPGKKIVLGRELTKMFEEVLRGPVEYVLEAMMSKKAKIKGEIVIIVA